MVSLGGQEQHTLNLTELCRICGGDIVLKTGYLTAVEVDVYSSVLSGMYGINVGNESKDIFPKRLCLNCSKKLYRSTKKLENDNSQLVITEFFPSAHFVPHCSDNCALCFKFELKKKAEH